MEDKGGKPEKDQARPDIGLKVSPLISFSPAKVSVRAELKGAGVSAIAFSDLLFLNSSGNDLGATAVPGSVTTVVGAVPEPASVALLGLGLGALGFARARTRRRSAATALAAA